LAEEAEKWTDNCIYEHGPLVPSKTSGKQVLAKGRGQNLYIIYPKMNLTRGVILWWSKRTEYNFATHTCHPKKFKTCGHYIQVEASFYV